MLFDADVQWTTGAGRAFISFIACWALYSVAVYLYRVTLHPLAGTGLEGIFTVSDAGPIKRWIVSLTARWAPVAPILLKFMPKMIALGLSLVQHCFISAAPVYLDPPRCRVSKTIEN